MRTKNEIKVIETITPTEAGAMIHKNADFIRVGLQQGRFNFGSAVQSKSGRWNYLIIKSKFLEFIGLNRKEVNTNENGRKVH